MCLIETILKARYKALWGSPRQHVNSSSNNAANDHVIGELSWFGLLMFSAYFYFDFSAHSLQMLARPDVLRVRRRNPNSIFTHLSTSISSFDLLSPFDIHLFHLYFLQNRFAE